MLVETLTSAKNTDKPPVFSQQAKFNVTA